MLGLGCETYSKSYAAFNARDIDRLWRLCSRMSSGRTEWRAEPSMAMTGVREYWTRQWGMLDPHVEPVNFDLEEEGES